jgi:hypothetical protein
MSLLGEYLNNQTYQGAIQWIIVDDCDPQTRIPAVRSGIDVAVIRPAWRWKAGMNTQAKCLSLALENVSSETKLLVLEDDDAYLPDYIQTMMDALEEADLVGERVSRYYNVRTKRYKDMPSVSHSSLACTAMTGPAIGLFQEICRRGSRHIDMDLWKSFRGRKKLIDAENVVGIKGLPGRSGIGVGHRSHFGNPDSEGAVLRKWLGEKASSYEQF